jgi:hypothetical protein
MRSTCGTSWKVIVGAFLLVLGGALILAALGAAPPPQCDSHEQQDLQ